jgi:thiosulfate/3-mercaptopyruvate sulfurtransferase
MRHCPCSPLAALLTALGLLCCQHAHAAPPAPSPLVQEQAREVFISQARAQELIKAGASILDARPASAFKKGHLPGARNIEWQAFVPGKGRGDVSNDDKRLTALLRAEGLSTTRPIIVYGAWNADGSWGEEGRLFWTLRYLGHDKVYILDGGWPAWSAAQPTATGPADAVAPGDLTIKRRPKLRVTTEALATALKADKPPALLDTRERVEYEGRVKYGESRGGHIPGAQHLWWADLIGADGAIPGRHALTARLKALGVTPNAPVVAYCTGGVRSGFVFAVLYALGYDAQNYDASMWDWTAQDTLPVEQITTSR